MTFIQKYLQLDVQHNLFFTLLDLFYVYALIGLSFFICIAKIMQIKVIRFNSEILLFLNLASILYLIFELVQLIMNGSNTDFTIVSAQFFLLTNLLQIAKIIFIFLSILGFVFLTVTNSNIANQPGSEEYIFLYATAVATGSLALITLDLINLWFAVTIFSIITYVLLFHLNEPMRITQISEAGLKYYFLSSISTNFMLYGLLLIFIAAASLNPFMLSIANNSLVSGLATEKESFFIIAFAFLQIGLTFKLSVFPGHFWAPEVYDAISDTTFILIVVPLKAFFVLLYIYLFTSVFDDLANLWQGFIIFTAVMSVLVGSFGALAETRLKRFIAFTSINQIGYILIAIGLCTNESKFTSLFFFFGYAVTTALLLSIYIFPRLNSYTRQINLDLLVNLRNLRIWDGFTATRNVNLCYILVPILFSFAGIPPFYGFFGKFFILGDAFVSGFVFVVFIALFTSLLSFVYYLRLLKTIFYELGQTTFVDFFGSRNFSYGLLCLLAIIVFPYPILCILL